MTECFFIASGLKQDDPESTDENFSYRELSQLSEVTDDVYAESVGEVAGTDLKNYNRLV